MEKTLTNQADVAPIPTVQATLTLLDRHQLAALLGMDDALLAAREALALHSVRAGRVFPLVRERLDGGAVFGIKSGDVPSQGLLGLKAAGYWPGNTALGAERHQATMMLFDPATGRPVCLIDGNAITTMRTGAAGAVGLALLARPDSATLCVFGTGVQARIQLQFAVSALPALRRVIYVSSSGHPDSAFEDAARRMGLRLDQDAAPDSVAGNGCTLQHAADANAAVALGDVIITATTGGGALFDAGAVRPGTHLNCVGADTAGKRELPLGLLARARVFADDLVQAGAIGELQWAPALAEMCADACAELGDLLTGRVAFARDPGDITVFDMTGLALQDLTVAHLLYRRALDTGVGTTIAWPW